MNKFINIRKMITYGEKSWDAAENHGLMELAVSYQNGPYLEYNNRLFINMCSCSYLGLDTHPNILEGAIEGIRKAKSLHLTTARVRIYSSMLRDLEDELSEHFMCDAMSYVTCSAATSAYLPVLASGVFTGDVKPYMIFDKNAHFSINHIKPICGDETDVFTSNHNDLNFIEDMCKKHTKVAYIADGTYSIVGHAPVKELLMLQDRYGLFLYFDDSHGLSIIGDRGQGYVRGQIHDLNTRTIVVASLAKAFGACGGILMSGNKKTKHLMTRYGNSWSQYLNSAGIGGIMASLKIHKSPELKHLQSSWWRNLQIIDQHFNVQNSESVSPIRIITLPYPKKAIELARTLFANGYYTSAVFFPIISRGMAGLRIMPRADMSEQETNEFCRVLKKICENITSSKN